MRVRFEGWTLLVW